VSFVCGSLAVYSAEKNILLGVTGSIAAFKACSLASTLSKFDAHVRTILTASALHFVGLLVSFPLPTTLLTLIRTTGHQISAVCTLN